MKLQECTYIIDHVYVSGSEAIKQEILDSVGVTHILNVAGCHYNVNPMEKYIAKTLNLSDSPHEDLQWFLAEVVSSAFGTDISCPNRDYHL